MENSARTVIFPALSLLSVSVIAFELSLMQLFSITQWYHFAYMVISVAMLGFGAAGTFLTLFKKTLLDRYDQFFPLLLFGTGLSMATVVSIAGWEPIRFDTYLLFNDWRQVWKLVLSYLLFFLPFFLAALALGLTFVRFAGQIGQLYFADLLGSGLGGLPAIFLMWVIPPWRMPALFALLPILAGLLFLWGTELKALRFGGGLALLFVGLLVLFFPPQPVLSEFKSSSKTLLLPEAEVGIEKNSPHGWMQVVSAPALRYAPGLSLNYPGEIPVRKVVFNNGEWVGSVLPRPGPDSIHPLNFTTSALPYRLQRPRSVLIPDAGTGEFIAQALANQVPRIEAVESNPLLVRLMKNELAKENDSLFYDPALSLHLLESRTFLKTDTGSFDLIILPVVSAFGGTAGLDAMQEQYLMTREAFREMWSRLTPEGQISISSWMDYPVRNPLKILATLTEVLDMEGIPDYRAHLLAIRSWGTVTFVLQRSPLSDDEQRKTRAFCGEMGFDPLILPEIRPGEREQYNQWQDTSFFRATDALLSGEREALYRSYDFNIRPATDKRPYFSQFLRWESLPGLAGTFGAQSFPFLEAGYLIVLLTFIQILLIAVVLIILPLFRRSFRGGHKGWIIGYFGGIGLGYLFVEIVLIQQFILYLGQPIYATAAVISFLLVSSGAGSYFSPRLPFSGPRLWMAPLLIAGLLLLYLLILHPALTVSTGCSPAAKLIILFLFAAPLGFLMGLPFPGGIRFLSGSESGAIPWAWGVNGYFSVISTALATIIAVELGFWWVMVLAALSYALAGCLMREA